MMINYYFEWEGDSVYRSDNGKVFSKSKGRQEVEIKFDHPGFQRSFMHGEKITKEQYDNF